MEMTILMSSEYDVSILWEHFYLISKYVVLT